MIAIPTKQQNAPESTIRSLPESLEIHALGSEINSLDRSSDRWNQAYLWLLFSRIGRFRNTVLHSIPLLSTLKAKAMRSPDDSAKSRQIAGELSKRDEAIANSAGELEIARQETARLSLEAITIRGKLDATVQESREQAAALESKNLATQEALIETERSLEQEREKRLEMERRIAPRRLDGKDREEFIRILNPLTSMLFTSVLPASRHASLLRR